MNLLNRQNLNIRMCHNFASTSKQIMRTTILIVLFFLGVTTANAQLERGKYLFGLSGSYVNNFNGSGTSFQISPKAGYFLTNRFALGASASYSHSQIPSLGYTADAYGIGPLVRYYFFPSVKYNLFVQPSFLYSNLKTVTSAPGFANAKLSSLANRYSIALAPVYFINEYIAIELIAEYQRATQNGPTVDDQFSIKLGIQVHL
jgi:hypothetical protein